MLHLHAKKPICYIGVIFVIPLDSIEMKSVILIRMISKFLGSIVQSQTTELTTLIVQY